MVGRNKSYSADYFSHDADASSDEKIMYLESKFGHTGYAIYFKLLERMARSDNFEICWDEIKISIYASEFGISVTEIKKFIKECCRKEIKAFVLKHKKLYSNGLKKRMKPLIEKREYNRKKYEEKTNNKNNKLHNSVTETMLKVTETTQSKGKERKGKEKDPPVIDFSPTAEKIYQGYIKHIQPKLKTKQRAIQNIITWLNRNRTDKELISAYQNYKVSMSDDPKYRKNPANFFGINEDYAFDFLPINFEIETKQLSEEEVLAKHGF